MQGIWSSQGKKKTRDYCFDMENEKTPRMEELESGQQEMQEKISRATKMVMKLQEKSPLVILIDWSFNIVRYLEFTRPEKDPRLLA